MIKFKLTFDKDKESAWLNELASQGKAMTGFFAGFYRFEKTEPGKWIYQIDFSDHYFGRVSDKYRSFMDEMGIEIVGIWGFWVFLRKRAAEGSFELYTDVDSKITHYEKIRKLFRIVASLEGILCLIEITLAMISGENLPLVFALILGVMLALMFRQTIYVNNIITELMEQKGEKNTYHLSKRYVSPVLLFGLVMNMCALAINYNTATAFQQNIKLALQILAIVFLVIGIIQTSKHR